jgi:N-methylhydantoinase B
LTYKGLILEVVRHNLTYISEEMGVALRRTAYSPNIRERADHSCAVLDPDGRTIGQAEHIPVHIGSFSLGLRQTLEFLENEHVNAAPGDMFIVNDPYISGTHLNDVTLIRPVFLARRLVGYTANKAHHVDVGGTSPASINPLAKQLDDEGTIIPPRKIMEGNKLRNDVIEILSKNARMPETTLGDLRAQVAANLLGERRLIELESKIGTDTFWDACNEILEQTHRLALARYAGMPRGTWQGEDYLELNGDLLAIRESVTVSDSGVQADFTGTTRQVEAPLNAVLGVTTAAVTFAVKTILPGDLPLNDGFNRTIRIVAPQGTMVNPVKPAPVAGGNVETSQRIVDTTYQALSKAMPNRLPASSHGSMNNLMMGGINFRTKRQWAFYETIGGGYGGRPGMDGVDAVQVNMTNTLNTPIEVIEHYYPVRFQAYKIRDSSGGPGEWRGGMGIERAFTAQERISITVLGDRNRIHPAGLAGGLPGKTAEYIVVRGNGQQVRLKSKDIAQLEPGDTIVVRTAGGGGYGDPKKRNPMLIKKDIENQFVEKE